MFLQKLSDLYYSILETYLRLNGYIDDCVLGATNKYIIDAKHQ